MRYQKSYTMAYALLMLITLFAPETYNVPLKYAFVPLMLMLLFGISGKGISLRLKVKPYWLACLVWIMVIVYASMTSHIVSWTPSARSFCLLLLIFALLYEVPPEERYMNVLKHMYIYLTFFCGIWIVLQSFSGINRNAFMFVSGLRDVNYLSAFMLPGIYLAIRFLIIEKQKQKIVYILCTITSVYGVLLLLSRAAFVTLLIVVCLCACEYAFQSKFTKRKAMWLLLSGVVALIMMTIIWNSDALSRITDTEGYGENIRLVAWESAMPAFLDRPIVGSGVGASSILSRAGAGCDTHNNYVDMIGDSGIVGLCMFVIVTLSILKVRKGERLHMFTFFVACMLPLGFINGLHTITFWLPMLLLAHEHNIIQTKAPVA